MPDPLRDRLQASLGTAYTLERELGGGGMSRVFVAEETALGRRVVVKTLAAELAPELSTERFAREVRLAARLQHPHIVPLLAAGDAGGVPYYTMPFVDGASLRERMARGPVPAAEALGILRDVAKALAYAHRWSVVHRDIKPENVLLSDGTAVVTDFGVARAVSAASTQAPDSGLTRVGSVVGTPAYMAPEQAAGDPHIDARADLYAFGVLAYELLAGRHPFAHRRSAFELVTAHLTEMPAPLGTVAPAADAGLAALVAQCLAKDPAARPATASTVLDALDAVPGGSAVRPASPVSEPAVAVLPFTNLSADPDAEFFGDGIAADILNELAKVAGLRTIARTSSFALKGERADVRNVGARLGARYVLDGGVRKLGQRLRLTTQLVDAESGVTLWSERYDRELVDVFAVQDEVTAAIRDALSAKLLGISTPPKRATPEIDPATYELYLRGKYLLERRVDHVERAMEALGEVTRRAPRYAPALFQLANAHRLRVVYGASAPAESWAAIHGLCEQAVEADPHYGPALHMLAERAFHWEWNWERAASLYRRALDLDPSEPEVLANYAMFLCSTHEFERALELAGRAAAVDPLNPTVHLRGAIVRWLARRYDDVVAACDRVIEIAPQYAEAHRWKGIALFMLGRTAAGLSAIEQAVAFSERNVWAVFNYGLVLAAVGRVDEARVAARELVDRARAEPLSDWVLTLEPMLHDPPDAGQALALIERAVRVQRTFWCVMFDVEPWVDQWRGEPRFQALLREIGIPTVLARDASVVAPARRDVASPTDG